MERSKSDGGLTESLLIITGTMGAGKTAAMGEASDILAQRQIVHAAIDVDALSLAHFPSAAISDGVMYDNLRSICRNYASLGVQRFLVARAIEDGTQLRLFRDIIPAANTIVCPYHREHRSDEATRTDARFRDIAARIYCSGCDIE